MSEEKGSGLLHRGMKDQSASSTDKSTTLPKGPSVNEGTRDSVAPTPGTVGPEMPK